MEEEKKEVTEEVAQETNTAEVIAETPKKGNKKVVKGKSLTVFIIVIVVLAMAIAFGCGYVLHDKLDNNKKEEPKQQEPKKDEPKQDEPKKGENQKVALNETEIEAIMPAFNSLKIVDSNLYSNDKYEVSNMTDSELLLTGISSFGIKSVCADSNASQEVTVEMINERIKKYVDASLTMDRIKQVDFDTLGGRDYCYGVEILNDTTLKVTNCNCGSLADGSDFILTKIISGEKEGDFAYVYEKAAFGRYKNFTMSSDNELDYYLNYARTGKIVETLGDFHYSDENGNPMPGTEVNWDLYNTYKYTFKLVDGEYYFQSLELVK